MRVLVVDDERGLARAIQRGLDAEGLLTQVAHDGPTALELALDGGFDAIVLDIMLPGMNGYDVCRRLREAQVWVPILMLSAKDGDLDQVDAFDLGADDYLVKPFSFPLLVARLRALIRRGDSARPATLEVGDLSLDPAGRRVFRGDVEVVLTPREFGLLQHLMRHPGLVVSKLSLLCQVWDVDHDGATGADNVVEVYVGYLRRKVDAPFGRRSIETVRGAGYRIVPDRPGRRP